MQGTSVLRLAVVALILEGEVTSLRESVFRKREQHTQEL